MLPDARKVKELEVDHDGLVFLAILITSFGVMHILLND